MIRIVLPDSNPRLLAFFLALEEWVASSLPPNDYFFTWIVEPTVIIGHNQDIEVEVDREYCRKNCIDIVRRRSGGGCVYADLHNIMMSYVTPDTEVETVFARYTSMMAQQLRKMGIDAQPSGRNDITVGERKISGNAFYALPDRSIVHGTMLFDTDMVNMLNAITPTRAKLESHKVKSVESRITTVKSLKPEMERDVFHNLLTDGLEDSRKVLTESDIEQIKKIEQKYYNREWLEKGSHHKKQP